MTAQRTRFVFTDGWATDFVFDFEPGTDKRDVSGLAGINGIGDLTVTDTPDGHCYIRLDANLIAVANMAGQITAGDFVF